MAKYSFEKGQESGEDAGAEIYKNLPEDVRKKIDKSAYDSGVVSAKADEKCIYPDIDALSDDGDEWKYFEGVRLGISSGFAQEVIQKFSDGFDSVKQNKAGPQ